MSCLVALMALDIGEIKPLLKKGANLTLAYGSLTRLYRNFDAIDPALIKTVARPQTNRQKKNTSGWTWQKSNLN